VVLDTGILFTSSGRETQVKNYILIIRVTALLKPLRRHKGFPSSTPSQGTPSTPPKRRLFVRSLQSVLCPLQYPIETFGIFFHIDVSRPITGAGQMDSPPVFS
jgi:hypothetical protein